MQELKIIEVYETSNIAEVLEMADGVAGGKKQSDLQKVFRLRVSIVENTPSLGE